MSQYIVSSGITSSGVVLKNDTMYVLSSGRAVDTTVNSSGDLSIFNGGVANNTTVNDRGYLCVSNGGVANYITVNNSGVLYISCGGSAVNVIWTPCIGRISAYDGAYVTYASSYTGVYFGSNNQLLSHTDSMTGKTVTGSMYVMNCGVANNTTVNYDGFLYISSGGVANNTTVNSLGFLYISSGGVANNTTVNSSGYLSIFSGGVANSTTISGYNASMTIFHGGVANNTTVNGYLSVSSGGVANNTTVNQWGGVTIFNGGVANNTTVNSSGDLYISNGGKHSGSLQIANDATVSAYSGATIDFTVSEQADPNTALINDWSLISGGDDASYTITVKAKQAPGIYVLANGASGFNKTITIKTTAGTDVGTVSIGNPLAVPKKTYTLTCSDGTLKLNISGASEPEDAVKLYSSGILVSSADIMTGKTLAKGGNDSMTVSNGGVVNDTTVSSSGTLHISEGGVASNTTVRGYLDFLVYGEMHVSSGGVASNTTVGECGSMTISGGGSASNITVKCTGSMTVSKGGIALNIRETGGYVRVDQGASATFVPNTISGLQYAGFKVTVHSGTTARKIQINGNGDLYVYDGGIAEQIAVWNGGRLEVSSGTVSDVTLHSNGYLEIEGGAASGIAASGGTVSVHNGNVWDTTINSGGYLRISSGSVASGTRIDSWGYLYVFRGGEANNTILNESKSKVEMWVCSGGTASHTTVNCGSMTICSGGVAKDTAVYNGGYLYLQNGATHSGSFQIAYFATVLAYSGATIDFTVAEQADPNTALINDWSRISGGTNANYTITVNVDQAYGTYVLAGNAAGFASTVSLTVGDTTYTNALSVGGSCTVDGTKYLLNRNGDQALTLEITDTEIQYTLSGSVNTTYDGTAKTISVTVTNPATGTAVYYSVDGGTSWTSGSAYSLTDAGNAEVCFKIEVSGYTTAYTDSRTITIDKRSVTLTSNDASKKYNGTALAGKVTVTGDGFVEGEATASASSITDAGSITNAITVNEGTGFKAGNYEITKQEGTLTVTKRSVALKSADASKIYDGTPLTNDTVTVSGDGWAAGEGATYDVTGSQTEVGSSPNTFSYTLNNGTKADNYTITKQEGTLTVNPQHKVELYSSGILVSAANTMTHETLAAGGNDSMTVYSGGVANDTLVEYGGRLFISSGGVANETLVKYGGVLNFQNGGIGEWTTVQGGMVNASGAIFIGNSGRNGGAIFNGNSGVVNVSDGSFTGNSASSSGGAIYNVSSATATITGATFSGNTASCGGAICNHSGTVNIFNGAWIRNSAIGSNYDAGGGAIYNVSSATATITGATFSGNNAGERGGAIYNTKNATLSIADATFSGNNAGYGGGAIYNSDGTATINGGSFVGNSAYDGGAICNLSRGYINIAGTFFSGNNAGYGGGAIYNANEAEMDQVISITGANFTGNSAGSAGGAIYNANEVYHGRAMVSITNATFNGNSAGTGGAIYNTFYNNIATITSATFSGNSATNNGGAIYNSNGTATITSATFSGNSATNNGGAIYNFNGTATLTSATFSGNTASSGGAICNYGTATLTGAIFSGNSAGNGGAILNGCSSDYWGNGSGIMNVTSATFSGNSATNNGGAIYNTSRATVTLTDANFHGNTASCGGAIYNYGTITLTDANFHGNTASCGGAIYNKNGTINVSGAMFSGNSASQGGAIYNENGTINVFGAMFSGNSASQGEGGAIYNRGTLNLYNALTLGTDTDTIYNTGTLNWQLSNQFFSQKSDFSISNWQLVTNAGSLRVTVSDMQQEGTYLLANNAADFSGSISVYNLTGKNLGTLTVDSLLETGSRSYTLSCVDGLLQLTVARQQFSEEPVELYSSGILVSSAEEMQDVTLASSGNNGMNVTCGGIVSDITLSAGGVLQLSSGSIATHVNFQDGILMANGATFSSGNAGEGGAVYGNWYKNWTGADLQFLDNTASNGGAIINNGTVTIDKATFSGNSVSNNGGAIHNVMWGTFTDAVFTNNSAAGDGGAVYNYGTATIVDATFSGNTANNGGAIYNYQRWANSNDLSVSHAVFSGNSANCGGAIHNTVSGNAIVEDTIFSGNSASNQGGAIYNTGFAQLSIADTIFSGNNASSQGGAIYNTGSALLSIADTIFSGNWTNCVGYTYYAGGAIYNQGYLASASITGGAFIGNSGAGWNCGGAICNFYRGYINIAGTFFSGNSAGAQGGAICNYGYADDTMDTITNISAATFVKNNAYWGGGAIYNRGTVNVSDTVFSGNCVDHSASWTGGGAIRNGDGYLRGTVNVHNTIFAGNSTGYGGGAIRNDSTATATIIGATFTGNSAGYVGGAIYNSGATTITGATFTGNNASHGGAIYNSNGTATLTSATFSGNTASSGGAVYNGANSVITLTDAAFVTAADSIYNAGTMTFAGTISLAARLDTTATVNASGATIVYDLSGNAHLGTGIISDLSKISGANYQIRIADEQLYGGYRLAENAADFAGSISVHSTSDQPIGTLTVGSSIQYNGTLYTLSCTDGVLILSGTPAAPSEQYAVKLFSSYQGALILAADTMTGKWVTDEGASYLTVSSGGVANDTNLSYYGSMTIFSGGMVNDTNLSYYGSMTIFSGGMANNTTVNSNGYLYVSNGAMHSGMLQIADGATVSAYSGATIDFTVAQQEDPNTALINDWSRIKGGSNANYTITVKADQAYGTYVLAGNAAGFASTVSLTVGDTTYPNALSVGGSCTVDGTKYLLNRNGDQALTLEITATSKSIEYTLSESVNTTYDGTAKTISVTVTNPATGTAVYYSVDGGTSWTSGSAYSLTDAGNATVCFKIEASGYTTVTTDSRTITIGKRSVTLTSNDTSQKYDGTALEGEVTVTGDGFVDGEATASASSLTDAGSITNAITVNEGTGFKAGNYEITKQEGTLTVTKRSVTLKSADASKLYDGTPLTNGTVTVSGDGWAAGEGATYDVTGSQTEVGSSPNTFSYTLNNGTKADNYTITKQEGTLTVNSQAGAVKLYSSSILVSAADTMTGETLAAGGNNSMTVSSGGVANNTTVNSSGYLHISNGGVANDTTVNSRGYLYVSSGGVASDTTINTYGSAYISSGGSAINTTIDGYRSWLTVYAGGVADDIQIKCDGRADIFGGKATDITVAQGGWLFVFSNGSVADCSVSWCMYISSGGVANDVTVNSGGELYISSCGFASGIVAAEGVHLELTVASNTYIQGISAGSAFEMKDAQISGYTVFDGRLTVFDGGVANNTTVSSGYLDIFTGGVANYTTVNSNGWMYVSSGGVATDTIVNNYGHLYVSSGGVANNTTVNGDGYLCVEDGGVANSTTISGYNASMTIFNGGVANDTTVNGDGYLGVEDGGVANYTTVNSSGYLHIANSGLASHTILNPNGRLIVDLGATAVDTVFSGGGITNFGNIDIVNGNFLNNSNGAIYNNSGTVTIVNTVFSGNSAASAGAIYNASSGTVTISGGTFIDNSADVDGGAIYNSTCNTLTVSGATFSGNRAQYGGAVYNTSSATAAISGGAFTGNSATNYGGAIYNASSGTVTITSTTFTDNSAWQGGAIFNSSASIVNASGATFSVNSANYGGAIYNENSGTVNVSSATFSGNSAWKGGAIYNSGYGTVNIFGGSFVNNSADNGGMTENWYGRMNISGTVFSGNVAVGDGGAINHGFDTLTITDAVFTGNQANLGGALRNYHGAALISGAVFSGNSANYGGAISNENSGTVDVSGAVFTGNSATSYGGAIYNKSNCTVELTDAEFTTASDTIYNLGTMTFAGTITLAANLYTENTINATGATVALDLSSYDGLDTAIVSDISKISGASYQITVGNTQATGSYVLANGAGSFSSTITVKTTGGTNIGTISVGTPLAVSEKIYTLTCSSGILKLDISKDTPQTGAVKLYSSSILVSEADTMTGETLAAGGNNSMTVSSGGVANYTTVNSSGYLHISNGGVASNTTVNGSGRMYVSSGGVAKHTTVNSSGRMYVSSGGVAKHTTVNSDGCLYVFSGGVASNTTVNSYGDLLISNGGVASNTTVNGSDGCLYVFSGGVANDTTVSSDGYLYVSKGGVANNTTVSSGGHLSVSNGGSATNIVWTPCVGTVSVADGAYVTYASSYTGVYFGSGNRLLSHGYYSMTGKTVTGSMYIMNGGVANNTTVRSSGYLYVFSGGVANNTTTFRGGYLDLSSGGVASGTTVSSGGHLSVHNGGVANYTTVNSNGWMYVSSGGVATDTIVNNYGHLYVSSGGVANGTSMNGGYLYVSSGGSAINVVWTPCVGTVSSADGAYVTYASSYTGVYFGSGNQLLSHTDSMTREWVTGSMYIMDGGVANNTTVRSSGYLYVFSGGVANDTTVYSRGRMYVFSGGMASNTTVVDRSGYLAISSGGVANDTTVNGSYLDLYSGGAASGTTVNGYYGYDNYGFMTILNGGVANDTIVNSYGFMTISSGGVANNTTVNGSGYLRVSNGGKHSGMLQIANGATVSAYSGATIDFTVAQQEDPNTALINDWSRIKGGSDVGYSITVNASQTPGTYVLAGNAADFASTVSLTVGDTTYANVLRVDGSYAVDGTKYLLNRNGDQALTLEITDAAIQYTLSESVSTTYDGSAKTISVTVTNPATGTAVYYSVDGGTSWTSGSAYSLTDAGNATVCFKIEASGYTTVTTDSRTITIGKRSVTLKSADASKIYDGTPLTNGTVTVSGDGWATGEGATYTVTGSQTEVGSSPNTFSYTLNNGTKANNYTITKQEGTLTVNPQTGAVKLYSSSILVSAADTMTGETLAAGGNDSMTVSSGGVASNTAVNNGGVLSFLSGGIGGHTDVSSGGILNASGAIFSGNSAGTAGGAINNNSGGSVVNLWDVTFSGNSATDHGGAIFNTGSMTITDGEFVGNQTESGNWTAEYGGGAIYNDSGSITMTDVRFCSNRVTGTGGYGGAFINAGGSAVLSEVEFQNNEATTAAALCNAAGELELTSGTFADNRARSRAAICNFTTIRITDTTFSNNTASSWEAGAFFNRGSGTLTRVLFNSNSAATLGGAICNGSGGTVDISEAIFSGNSAATGGAIYNNSGCALALTDAEFATASDTIYNLGTMTFAGTITLAANLYTENTIDATGATVALDLSGDNGLNTAIISDLSKISGGSYQLIVQDKQTVGIYKLADNASDFAKTITVRTTAGAEIGTLTVGEPGFATQERSYSLDCVDGLLQLTVARSGEAPAVELVSSGILVSAANVMTGETLAAGGNDKMNVYSGGVANDTTISSGGNLFIYNGGTANNMALTGGTVMLYGSVTEDLAMAGTLCVNSGAVISGNVTASAGMITVSSGGTVGSITVSDGAVVKIQDGGIAAGTITVGENGVLEAIAGNSYHCDMELESGSKVLGYYGVFDGTITIKDWDKGSYNNPDRFANIMLLTSGSVVEYDLRDAACSNANAWIWEASYLRYADDSSKGFDNFDILVDSDMTYGTFFLHNNGNLTGNIDIYAVDSKDNRILIGTQQVLKNQLLVGTMFEYQGYCFQINKTNGYATYLAIRTPWELYSGNTRVDGGKGMVCDRTLGTGESADLLTLCSATAVNVVLSSGGKLYVSHGSVASDITISNGGCLRVWEDGLLHNATLQSNGEVLIFSGGVANNTTVNSKGYFNVQPGGIASHTTVNGGIMYIRSGVANDTTVNDGGNLRISSGGVANDTTVNGGYLNISSGGAANDTIINVGRLRISSGGVANNTIINSGDLYIFDGGAASNTTVNGSGDLRIFDGGVANNTIINSGDLRIFDGGVANDTTVNGSGYLYIFDGGVVNNTTVTNGGELRIFDGGVVNNTTVTNGGELRISNGGAASNTTVNSSGYLHIANGGVASDTTINTCGSAYISGGGSAINTTIDGYYSWLTVYAGGVADDIQIKCDGRADISGGKATDITVAQDGWLFVFSGGRVADCSISGRMFISSGGKFSGRLQIADGATVSAYSGATIDFTVAQQEDPNAALINDWSRIKGGSNATYTITVNADQAYGTYVLAGNAGSFSQSITVTNVAGEDLGSLSVGGYLVSGDRFYGLSRDAEGTMRLSAISAIVDIVAEGKTVLWNAVDGASGYRVSYSEDNGATWWAEDTANTTYTYTGSASDVQFKVQVSDGTNLGNASMLLSPSADLKTAAENAQEGDKIQLAAGTYEPASAITIGANNVALIGQGADPVSGTILTTVAKPIYGAGNAVTIKDLKATTNVAGGAANTGADSTDLNVASAQLKDAFAGSLVNNGTVEVTSAGADLTGTQFRNLYGAGYVTGVGNVLNNTTVALNVSSGCSRLEAGYGSIFGAGRAADGATLNAGTVNVTVDNGNAVKLGALYAGGYTNNGAVNTTAANVTIKSGDFAKFAAAGAQVYGDNADSTITDTVLTISGGIFENAVLGASYAAGGATASVTAAVTAISGGAFNGYVAGGGYANGGTTTVGSVNFTVTGGTFNKYLFGGNLCGSTGTTEVTGQVYLTLDASENKIKAHAVYAGSMNCGTVDSTVLEVKGLGSNLSFGRLSGGGSHAEASAKAGVTGDRELKFTGFNGELSGNLFDFDTFTMTGSTVEFGLEQALSDISTWNLNLTDDVTADTALLDWSEGGSNDFAGDTMNLTFDTTAESDLLVISGAEGLDLALSGDMTVTFNGNAASYADGAWSLDGWKLSNVKTTVDDVTTNDLVLSKLA